MRPATDSQKATGAIKPPGFNSAVATPTGAYTVTVTGTSGGASASHSRHQLYGGEDRGRAGVRPSGRRAPYPTRAQSRSMSCDLVTPSWSHRNPNGCRVLEE